MSKTTLGLTIAGALLGGGFPGSLIAFQFAAASGFGGVKGEAVCIVANILLGIFGAIGGLFIGQAIRNAPPRWLILLVAAAIGALAGTFGYFWLDYAISQADPPL